MTYGKQSNITCLFPNIQLNSPKKRSSLIVVPKLGQCYDPTRHFLDLRKMTFLTNFGHNFRTVKKLRRKIDQFPYILVLSLIASFKTTIKELKTIREEFDMKIQNNQKLIKKYCTPPLLFLTKILKI